MMKVRYPTVAARSAIICSVLGWSAGVMGQGAGGNDAMLLLLEQNRNLQAEVQALRALVEEQSFEIRRLQRQSLDRYTDTDTRLRNLEQTLSAGSGTGVPAPIAGAEPSVAAPTTTVRTIGGNRDRSTVPVESSSGVPANRSPQPGSDLAQPGINDSGVAATGSSSATRSAPGSISTRPGLEPAVMTEQQLYQMAYDSAINNQFERAIAEFDQYLSIYPQGRFTTNSHYWKGQSFLYLSRYGEAIAEYDVILQQYPDDAKVPDSLYGQAIAYEGMGDEQTARQLLQRIIREYRNTGVANLADTRLRSLN